MNSNKSKKQAMLIWHDMHACLYILIMSDADVNLVGTHAAKKAADMVLQGQFGKYRAHSMQATKYMRKMRYISC